MKIKSKSWLGRLFCKHDFQPYTKTNTFQHLQGERVFYFCSKCGKVGHSGLKTKEG